jgi:2OG-Fe(II) oxygenase superfamily
VLRLPPARSSRAEFSRSGFVVAANAVAAPVLSGLVDASRDLVRESSVTIDRTSGDRGRLWYRVVTGDTIAERCPALFAVYHSDEMLDWIRALTESPSVSTSPHLRSSININCLDRTGQGYPGHVDATPFTAVLFLSSLSTGDGGEFQIQSAEGDRVGIRPHAGDLIVMDGTRCPHGVAPLRRQVVRLTVPMVYPAGHGARPAGLDEFLYGGG